jgi:tRNA nucleotidyltransferase (CCA-adding enzyme)
MEEKPSRMFEVLRECGALKVVLPEVDRLWGVPQRADYHPEVDTGVHLMMVLDMAARLQAPLGVRFACLAHDLGKGTTPPMCCRATSATSSAAPSCSRPCERLRVPADCRELADVVAREHGNIHRSGDLGAAALVRLLERCDAIRKPAAARRSCWPASATRAAPGFRGKALSPAPAPQRRAHGGAIGCYQCDSCSRSIQGRYRPKSG